MRTEDTPDRRPEEPQTAHHFETPVVHEAPPAGAPTCDHPAGADSASAETTTRPPGPVRGRAN
jgi:hypothetical protein